MKRILSLLICISLILSMAVNVYAAENVITVENVVYDCGSMTVSGTLAEDDGSPLANKAVTIKLAQSESGPEGVAVLDEIKTDETGAFKITAQLPAEKEGLPEDGVVTLYVKAWNISEPNELPAYYVKKSERDKVINELAEISSVGEMANKLEVQSVKSALAVIGIDMSYFERLPAGKIAEVLAASNAFADKSEPAVKKAVNGALWVADVNNGNAREVLKIWNPVFSEIAFNDITDSAKQDELAQNVDNGKMYANFEALEKAYAAANVLYDINRARSGEMEEILALASECGLDSESYSAYKNMDYTKKTAVGDALVISISKSKVGSMTELNSRLAAAIIEAGKTNTKPGGSSNWGSSSGQGSITSIQNSTSTNISQITEPVKDVNLTDMESASWAKEAVEALVKRGIVSGYEDGTFRPNDGVKREEFVKMLSAAMGMSDSGAKCSYDDVPADSWYYPAVAFCTGKNIVRGVSESKFGTGMEITRQDMATIVYRAVGAEGKTLSSVRTYNPFDDENDIGDYALEAVKTLYSAGKINGVSDALFLPDNTCTRAQAAKIIYEVFVVKSSSSGNLVKKDANSSANNTSTGTTPVDVNKINYNSKAIGVLEGLGIAAGYTSENFDENAVVPAGRFINMLLNITTDDAYTGDTVSDEGLQKAGMYGFIEHRADAEEKSITYGNAVKMVMDFLGYKQAAEINGGFPNGYKKEAQDAELELKGINWEEKLTAGAAADLIYSAIKAKPMNAKYSAGGTAYEIVHDENVLEYYRNIHIIMGLMDKNSLTSLTDGNISRRKYVGIGGKDYAVSDYTYDDLLGYSTEAYIQEYNGEEPKLLYAMPYKSKNKTLSINLKDVNGAEDNLSSLSYYENGGNNLRTARLNAALKVIYNKKAYNSYKKDDFLNKRGLLTLIDNDGDGNYDVAKIDAYEVMVVKYVDGKGNIHGKFTYEGALKQVETNETDVTVIADGSEINVSSLKEFDVIDIYSSRQAKNAYIKIIASSQKVSGKINGISNEDEENIIVGEKRYTMTNSLKQALDKKDPELKQINVGNEYDIYLDAFGDIAWIAEQSSTIMYGYFRNSFKSEDGGSVYLDILNTNGEWMQVICADKVNYNGSRISSQDLYESIKQDFGAQMIEYKLNADSKITALNTAVMSGAYKPDEFTTTGKAYGRYCRGDYAFDSRVFLKDGAKIFIVPAGESTDVPDRDNCGVVSATYLINEKYYDYQGYNCDKYGYSDIFVVYTSLTNFEPTGQTPLFLVESKKDVSVDGTVLTMVNGASADSKLSVSADADEHIFDDIDKGDIISITTGLAGKIYVKKYYDYTEDGSKDTEDITINEWDEKRSGVLREIDLNNKRLIIGSETTRTMRWFDNISVSIYDAETDEVTIGSLKDLQEGDYLWIRLAWRQMKEVVAIRHK